jgi:fido (protein-threonine AMPylation protein)
VQHGEFDVSFEPEFENDLLLTEAEVRRSGAEALVVLKAAATSAAPPPVDVHLVRDIHRRWFETTFPAAAGRERTVMVLNRKGTAEPVETIVPSVVSACANWSFRRRFAPVDEGDLVGFLVAEANTLAVRIYDVHPFIDGNTRATWHLRNYVLMLDGLLPLGELQDFDAYDAAWWGARQDAHEELDRIVLEELDAQDQ